MLPHKASIVFHRVASLFCEISAAHRTLRWPSSKSEPGCDKGKSRSWCLGLRESRQPSSQATRLTKRRRAGNPILFSPSISPRLVLKFSSSPVEIYRVFFFLVFLFRGWLSPAVNHPIEKKNERRKTKRRKVTGFRKRTS